MKHLYLVRHAKSSWSDTSLPDFDRPLNDRGKKDAPEMARRLLHLFGALNDLGTTVVVATHDLGLIASTPRAELMRLDSGALVDPTGSLRNPPRTDRIEARP